MFIIPVCPSIGNIKEISAKIKYIINIPLTRPYIIPPISLNCFTRGSSDTASNNTFANINNILDIINNDIITKILIILIVKSLDTAFIIVCFELLIESFANEFI